MEPSSSSSSQQHLAIESFSRSWLTSLNPSFDDGVGHGIGDISHNDAQFFNFDVPVSQSPEGLADADQLFSDGLIKPVFVNQKEFEASSCSLDLVPDMSSTITTTTSVISSRTNSAVISAVSVQCRFPGRWRKLPGQFLKKCFRYLRPFRDRVRGSRKSIRVDDIDTRSWEVKSWNNSMQASPRRLSNSYVSREFDESSIYEAVLHCKRSIGK